MAAPLVSVALRSRAWTRELPRIERFAARVVRTVFADRVAASHASARSEVGVVFADDPFVRRLNRDHRGMDRPTNVLAFPLAVSRRVAGGTPLLPGDTGARRPVEPPLLLGDVVLAYRTVRREARAQGKRFERHAAHLLVHGVLHLLGYDHVRAKAARAMERHEVRILARLGVPDPYGPRASEGRPP